MLTAIKPDQQGVAGGSFGPNSSQAAFDFVEKHNGEYNMYFSVNRPTDIFLQKPGIKKADKENIQEAGWLHIDIDPTDGQDLDQERERSLDMLTGKLPKGMPKPTVIIFSGGGYQGFWKLKNAVPFDGTASHESFELYNRRLIQILGGDANCYNLDRIMRLPGTVNVPNAKKRKMGRVEELALLLEFNPKHVYDISEFKKAHEVQSATPLGGGDNKSDVKIDVSDITRIEDLSELDEWEVPDRVKIIIAQGSHPEKLKEGDNSRSAWLFDCVCSLVRCGVPDQVIYSLLTDPDWGIASSVVELKSGAERYATRQISRAKSYCVDPHMTMMNDRHAVIRNIGGKCRVIEEVYDDTMSRSRLTMSSFEDIRNGYSNQQIKIGTTDKGDVFKTLGKYWLDNPTRRQFDTMRFMPLGHQEGVYNLWQGFAYEPTPGNCDIYLNHLLENVCSGNQFNYDYLIKWMAMAIQHPAQPGEVAVVLRGGKGTGKGTFAKIFGKLWGRHHLQIANPSHLVGNFNAHLRDVVSLFADEAFFAGDKRHESVLKMLVTEESIPIEAKGYDTEPYPNYVHLIMASNDPHVIRASGDERRYFVLDMSEAQQQNEAYFDSLFDQMDSGGYEALLYHLQSMDLSDFRVRKVPQTDALEEQKMRSLSMEEEWWYNKIEDGTILANQHKWTSTIPRDALFNDYIAYADKLKLTRRSNQTQLGRFLSKISPALQSYQASVTMDEYDSEGRAKRVSRRVRCYDFGSLETCRAHWEKQYGRTTWPSDGLPIEQPARDPF